MTDSQEEIAKEISFLQELGFHPLKHYNTVLLSKEEGLFCTLTLLENKIRILGIDGFIIKPDSTESPLESLANFSGGQPTAKIVKNFFDGLKKEVTHIEIVLELPAGA